MPKHISIGTRMGVILALLALALREPSLRLRAQFGS
jgi:hypothetical protein